MAIDSIHHLVPIQLMKFTLTYEGDLPASGNKPKPAAVWAIRREMHPQLEELCKTHPALDGACQQDYYQNINVKGYDFFPILRKRLHMYCHLNINFLRKMDHMALVHQGGDIDNRVKTLFDGLRVPDNGDEVPNSEVTYKPMYGLLESDSLINSFSVKTDKLLGKNNKSEQWVSLVIDVDISVSRVTVGNSFFLGD